MSHAGLHADAFYRDIAKTQKVWAIRDNNGFPAPKGEQGKRSIPFWSTRSRAEKIINNVAAYSTFEIVELDWQTFRDKWLVGMQKDGLNVGVNWSGEKAFGYDVYPEQVRQNVEQAIVLAK
jgi:hypothetical protein